VTDSPLLLPVRTLYLAGRYVVPLVLWFTVGRLLSFLLVTYGADLTLKWPYVTWGGVSLLVMVSLGVTVAMLHSVRDGLPGLRDRDLAARHGLPLAADAGESLLDALGRAIVPFMIIYMSWSFFTDDVKTWANAAFDRAQAQGRDFGTAALDAINALSDDLPVALAITVGFWLLRVACERWVVARLPRAGNLLTAFAEIGFALFGLYSISEILGRGTGWLTTRRIWAGVSGAIGDLMPAWAGDVLPAFTDAVLQPLIWLAMAGVVLGVAMEREDPGEGRLARSVIGLLAATPGPVRRLAGAATQGTRDKWVPMVNGLRLIRRAGPLTFAVFAVLLVLIDQLHDRGYRRAVELLGPHPYAYWEQARVFLGFGFDLLRQVLRVCLLAATFDLVVRRIAGAGERHRDHPDPAAPERERPPAAPGGSLPRRPGRNAPKPGPAWN
jgi:hypothetical protein